MKLGKETKHNKKIYDSKNMSKKSNSEVVAIYDFIFDCNVSLDLKSYVDWILILCCSYYFILPFIVSALVNKVRTNYWELIRN